VLQGAGSELFGLFRGCHVVRPSYQEQLATLKHSKGFVSRKIFNICLVVYNGHHTMAQHVSKFYPGRQHLLLLILVAVAVYVLLPQFGDFRSSWHLLSHPQASSTLIAVAMTFATYASAAGTYCFLAFRRLMFGRTLMVQLASMFINRLLPAGIGALGANYLYLRHERHKASQAASIVAINNLLGLLGHGLLLAGTLLFFGNPALTTSTRHGLSPATVVKVAVTILAVFFVLALIFGWRKVSKSLADLKEQLLVYRKRPLSLLAALATSVSLTLFNVLCLVYCLHALGLQLPFTAVLLVFTFGVGTGAAVPTPGGLGGFEAGLAAGFVAYNVDPAPALGVALLYRFVSYWLPLGAGFVAFAACQRQKLFGATDEA
jgi:uncharacterized membrane protein YbhN (UPF0104 family)